MLFTICVRDRPAATINIPAMVSTLLLPKPANTVSASTQPVTNRATTTPRLVKDMGSLRLKNRTIMTTKMTRQITMLFISFDSLLTGKLAINEKTDRTRRTARESERRAPAGQTPLESTKVC